MCRTRAESRRLPNPAELSQRQPETFSDWTKGEEKSATKRKAIKNSTQARKTKKCNAHRFESHESEKRTTEGITCRQLWQCFNDTEEFRLHKSAAVREIEPVCEE